MNIATSINVNDVLKIVHQADVEVLSVYNNQPSLMVNYKDDLSPVTNADLNAHEVLSKGLRSLDESIAIVSEEQDDLANSSAMRANRYWLIDPLDGTKDFIARTGEFTICIALIEDGNPVFGFVSAPALDTVYYGGSRYGSFKQISGGNPVSLPKSLNDKVVLGSAQHNNDATNKYIQQHYKGYKLLSVGSQLKFCYVAEGRAAAYPRIQHTMKTWDIAAGHAIIEGAGGLVTRPNGDRIVYESKSVYAGDFVARANNQ